MNYFGITDFLLQLRSAITLVSGATFIVKGMALLIILYLSIIMIVFLIMKAGEIENEDY
ncbi:MAG: hypothetical protein O3C05_00610 [Proteobacteria bacterium]|nr:hypothetical protein [Pseudomonadota bacterium]